MHGMSKRNFCFLLISLIQIAIMLLAFCGGGYLDYEQMSVLAIGDYFFNVMLLRLVCSLPVISVPNVFCGFSLLFHCGQIIKEAFSIEGWVPLPFENYVNAESIQMAFWFFLFSQLLLVLAVGVKIPTHASGRECIFNEINLKKMRYYGKVLVAIGILPKLYIDAISYIGAMRGGYEGVYSIYIPQMVQSIAFFFDAGLFFLLFGLRQQSKSKWLFIAVILYKCLMMTTGGRQYNIGFLLLWIYSYYFVLYRITIKEKILLVIASVVGFMFVSTISSVRTTGALDLGLLFSTAVEGTLGHAIGNALGEFGSAFATLEVAVQYTPVPMGYGYGRTYIAGLLSAIPLVVNQIDFLSETVIFLHQLPVSIVFAFGGSYLGELYYNFAWFGLIGNLVLGGILANIQRNITGNDVQKCCMSIIVMTVLIIFVRGYFTDMMQKSLWLYLALYFIRKFGRQQGHVTDHG